MEAHAWRLRVRQSALAHLKSGEGRVRHNLRIVRMNELLDDRHRSVAQLGSFLWEDFLDFRNVVEPNILIPDVLEDLTR